MVSDTVNASIGLHYYVPGGDKSPVFIRLPKEKSLNIMKNGRIICMAMRTCALTQCQSLSRGSKNCVFTENWLPKHPYLIKYFILNLV